MRGKGDFIGSLPLSLRCEEPRFRWFAATTIRNAGEAGNKSGAGLEDAGATLWSVVCALGGRRTGTRTDRQSLRLPSTIVLRPRWSRITVRRQSANNVEAVRRARCPPARRVRLPAGWLGVWFGDCQSCRPGHACVDPRPGEDRAGLRRSTSSTPSQTTPATRARSARFMNAHFSPVIGPNPT